MSSKYRDPQNSSKITEALEKNGPAKYKGALSHLLRGLATLFPNAVQLRGLTRPGKCPARLVVSQQCSVGVLAVSGVLVVFWRCPIEALVHLGVCVGCSGGIFGWWCSGGFWALRTSRCNDEKNQHAAASGDVQFRKPSLEHLKHPAMGPNVARPIFPRPGGGVLGTLDTCFNKLQATCYLCHVQHQTRKDAIPFMW